MDDPTDRTLAWVGIGMLIGVAVCAVGILVRNVCVLGNTDVYTQLNKDDSPV